MKNPYLLLSLNIVGIFIIAILFSLVPDHLHNFFGDTYCDGWINSNDRLNHCLEKMSMHSPKWHWGIRHWLWFAMCIALFITQLFRIIEIIKTKFKIE